MKLLRHGAAGAERPGLLHSDGTIRDLSGIVPDIAGAVLSDAGLAALRDVDAGSLPAADGSHSLYCAVIVKKVDAQTRAKTSINELLRA